MVSELLPFVFIYIKKMAPNDRLSEFPWQQKPSKTEEPEGVSRKDKPLHGKYHRQIEEVAGIKKNLPAAGRGQTERQHRGLTHG